jgi:lysozyme family protein
MAFDTKSKTDLEALVQKPAATPHTEASPPPAHPLATVSAAPAAAPAAAHFEPQDAQMRKIYDANAHRVDNAQLKLSKSQQSDMKSFEANYAKHQLDYEKVAKESDLPPELIAAIHWREATGNFHEYLAQGDPLGKKAVHIPRNEPVRPDTMAGWDAAASDALGDKKSTQDKLDLHQNSTDMAAMATYAEYYNGVGYAARGKPSPYVFSGTDQYTSGKYVADGVYSAKTKDTQLGVMSMVQDLMDKEKAEQKPAGK